MRTAVAVRRACGVFLAARYAVLGAWAVLWAVLDLPSWHSTDWFFFEMGDRILLRSNDIASGPGGALHLYANYPRVQIGPPALLLTLPTQFSFIPGHLGRLLGVGVSMALCLVFLVLAEALGRTLRPDVDARRVLLLGGLIVVPVWATIGAHFMHADDALVLTATVGAMLAVARGRWVPAGLLLGVAIASKPWAVFMLPVIWGLTEAHRRRTVALSLGTALAFWLPFILADPTTIAALSTVTEPVSHDSGLRVLGVHTYDTPSWARAVQLPTALFLASLAAWRRRWIAAPVVGIAVRVALDPYTYSYYTSGLVAMALVWDLAAGRRRPWATVAALGAWCLPLLVHPISVTGAGWARLLTCAAFVAVVLIPQASTAPAAPAAGDTGTGTGDIDERADGPTLAARVTV